MILKKIKYVVWFLRESKRFTNMTYLQMILKYGGIKRAVGFANSMVEWDRGVQNFGSLGAYLRLNRVFEFETGDK